MAHIAGEAHIDAPIGTVVDVVADSRNEPSFNAAMTRVELLTPEPIRTGTGFRAYMGTADLPMLVELTAVERPHLLASRTTSPLVETSGTLSFTESGGGTTMRWDWQVRAIGWHRLLGLLFGPVGRRMEHRIRTGLTEYVESGRAG